ncbi:MAG: prolipoprotein diacylglyceryl transferase [Alicyclobacillus sp.]|nr:prolipoprotein diacylglyceryl transferase [Alicyclobacillus sp.]
MGNFPVRAYSTIFALAFLLGLGVTLYFARTDDKREYVPHVWNLAPWLLIGGIIGARFWQVFFFDWPYYSQHPGEIIAVWHGGLSIQGGITGAFIVGYWYVWKNKLDFWSLADLCAPGILLGQSIGRDANLMNGDAFGSPTHLGYGLLYPSTILAHQTPMPLAGHKIRDENVVGLRLLLPADDPQWSQAGQEGCVFCGGSTPFHQTSYSRL